MPWSRIMWHLSGNICYEIRIGTNKFFLNHFRNAPDTLLSLNAPHVSHVASGFALGHVNGIVFFKT